MCIQIQDENVNNSDDEREKEQKDKERQARMEASLREREKEVQRTLATHLRDRDKEREQHKHDEAVQHFNALLADLVSAVTLQFNIADKHAGCSSLEIVSCADALNLRFHSFFCEEFVIIIGFPVFELMDFKKEVSLE